MRATTSLTLFSIFLASLGKQRKLPAQQRPGRHAEDLGLEGGPGESPSVSACFDEDEKYIRATTKLN